MRDFDELLIAVDGLPAMVTAVVDAGEEHVLQGACDAYSRGIISPILIGDQTVIRRMLAECVAPDVVALLRIVHADNADTAAQIGVDLVADGSASALMKGHLHTDTFLHPILATLRTGHLLSHVFVVDAPLFSRLLFVTDAAMNIAPDLHAKVAILENSIWLARKLGVVKPRVGVISAVEAVNPMIASSVDAAALAKMSERGQIRGAFVDGPLALDNALSLDAAEIKGLGGEVAGKADILLVPDLVSGNVLAKAAEYLGGATLAGLVVGAKVPIMLTSRADPPRARVVSAALASLASSIKESPLA